MYFGAGSKLAPAVDVRQLSTRGDKARTPEEPHNMVNRTVCLTPSVNLQISELAELHARR